MSPLLDRPDEFVAPVLRQPAGRPYDIAADDVWLPANHRQLRDLLGKLLTQLDAMALSDRAHHAAKALITREVWNWWNGVYENATTSHLGDLAPIVTDGPRVADGPSNRWGWQSEQAWLDAHRGPEPDETATVKAPAGPTLRIEPGPVDAVFLETLKKAISGQGGDAGLMLA